MIKRWPGPMITHHQNKLGKRRPRIRFEHVLAHGSARTEHVHVRVTDCRVALLVELHGGVRVRGVPHKASGQRCNACDTARLADG